jgi:AMIN domain
MTAVKKHLVPLLLLASCAVAQNSARNAVVQRVTAVHDGDDLRVEVTLSSEVSPLVDTAIGPDRILIDLPGTYCTANTPTVHVDTNGILRIRTGQHSTVPMITRVVVDLDQIHPYTLKTEGNRVILTVGPAENAGKIPHGAPVAATTGNLIGVFHRKREDAPPAVVDNSAATSLPTPPATPSGPRFEPGSTSSASTLPAPPPAVAPAPSTSARVQNPGSPVASSLNQVASAATPASSPSTTTPAPTTAVAPAQAASVSSPSPASQQPSFSEKQIATANPAPSPAAAVVTTSPAPAPAQPATVSAQSSSAPNISAAPNTSSPSQVASTQPPASSTARAAEPLPKGTVEAVAAEPVVAEATMPSDHGAVSAPPAPASASAPVQPGTNVNPVDSAKNTDAASAPPATPVEIAAAAGTVASPEVAAPASAELSPAPEAESGAAEAIPPKGEVPLEEADASPTMIARSDDPSLLTIFKVKYVAEGVAYLDGGRAQGLTEGVKLEVEETKLPARQGQSVNAGDPRVVAELEVTAVAETSAVTEIHTPKRPVKVGDLAYLSTGDAAALVQQRALSPTRQYPAVISFTEGDTLDEEVRADVPRPPLPSVNRARGRIGIDTIETFSHGTSSVVSTDAGVVFRGDITRIGGTYWNLSGYWRGQLTKESVAAQQTLQETLNRTYHLNMTYDNPNSSLVAGFGRLFLPWAPSLDTIDGGYFGDRLSKRTLIGVFGGSTPDPSSWDYSPNRAIGGAFINFEGGEYNAFHYSATTGAGMSMIKWAANDPFLFIEDSVSYKRDIAIYESAQFDNPKGTPATPAPGPGLGRNFFTLRVNPFTRLELDANYNYFRQVPTFDPTLIGTGLLDKYLFQGFSAGGRLEILNQIWVSTNLGRSSGTGDAKSSLNEMYGITFGRIPWVNMRGDVRYSRFDSAFGTGSYDAVTLSRQMSERLRLELLLGQQVFASPITTNTHSKFLTGTVETILGPHYYLQGNFTTNRGDLSYDQFMFSMGYRFDSRRRSGQ